MDPSIAPSLEGLISRLLSWSFAFMTFAEVWHYLLGAFGLNGQSRLHQLLSWIHRYLEAFFLGLGRQWKTLGLLILAFSVATIVPIYETSSLKRQTLDQICRNAEAALVALACSKETSKLPKLELLGSLSGNNADTFQMGLWLSVLFLVGVVANFVVVRAKAKDTPARLFLVSGTMWGALWLIALLQDLLGR